MNKKYLSVALFAALMIGSTGTFTSCKDYDDDIEDLQTELDKKASVEDLTAKVAAVQSSIEAAKTEANAAKSAAEEARKKAEEALKAAQGGTSEVTAAELDALKRALEDADKALQAQIDKLASLDDVTKKVNALKEELKGQFATSAEISKVAAKVDALAAEVMSLIGHRLTSLSVIPTAHINGIAAITLTTLQYTPQKYQAIAGHAQTPVNTHPSEPVLDHVNANTKIYSVSTDRNEAYFHVSPNLGVRKQDIKMPSFDCIQSTNALTRGTTVTTNSPVQPVDWNIDKNVLTVFYKKTVPGSIAATGGHESGSEQFYMASLKAPIADENLTADEKKAGSDVYVNSEYVRLHEAIKIPYLANSRTDFAKAINGKFAVETQTDAKGEFYVHYHDSVCVYESKAGEYTDVKWPYDQPLDLKQLVKVCVTDKDVKEHNAHADLNNYKAYGLTFRFYRPTTPYITLGGPEGNTNKTDQQKFAEIDTPMNGHMTSKVYTVSGTSATAVGREPLVRVELVDTVNKALVAIRYMKVKWVKEVDDRPLSHNFNDALYTCDNYVARIGTQEMNEVIYHGAKDGGMTKQEFHAVYVDAGFDGISGKGEGKAEILINTESGVESYNIIWTLTHADIITKYPVWKNQETMKFSKVVYWKDPTGAYPTLVLTLTRTLYKPAFALYGYDGRYWKNNGQWDIFNVNPIVYNTIEYNPAWNDNVDHKNNPTCNIYTDLLNGFLNKDSKKPTIGADQVIYFTDKVQAGTKFDYATKYASTGVRYIFDKSKLEAANTSYKYNYFNGTSVVEKTATVSADGTILYINGEVAATIDNAVVNKCTDANNPAKGAITYNIKLQEATPDHAPRSGDKPTEAAKALVGKYIPVQLVADLCDDGAHTAAHYEVIKSYDAFIIEPLTVKDGDTDDFTDATIGGSTIDVKGAFTYISWNADETGKNYVVANTTGLQKALWEFYEVVPGEWMTSQIKTNLKVDASGNLIPTAGVTDGPLPSNTTVVYDGTNETLTYNNYSGTPVNWDYKIFIPVKFGYKWKSFTKTFEVEVKKNAGTPAE
ncbi:MAG: hypothetical protein MR319_11060 [Mediterranea sp.]|nr:hypothetical protein [Mediterranea sp.]